MLLERELCRQLSGKSPGHSTLHQEIVSLRQTLKPALRHGWLDRLPDFSEPYRSSPKISHAPDSFLFVVG